MSKHYQKDMHVDKGIVGIYTPTDSDITHNSDRLYLSYETGDLYPDGGELPGLSKREVEALIENLQQVIDAGCLDG